MSARATETVTVSLNTVSLELASMDRDFLSRRVRIASAEALTIHPIDSFNAAPGKCLENVKHLIAAFGGAAIYGWAFSGLEPISVSGTAMPPLYSRWCNHVIWQDNLGRLWEVTPSGDPS